MNFVLWMQPYAKAFSAGNLVMSDNLLKHELMLVKSSVFCGFCQYKIHLGFLALIGNMILGIQKQFWDLCQFGTSTKISINGSKITSFSTEVVGCQPKSTFVWKAKSESRCAQSVWNQHIKSLYNHFVIKVHFKKKKLWLFFLYTFHVLGLCPFFLINYCS